MDVLENLIKELIRSGVKTPEDLAKVKRSLAKRYKTSCPSNISLLKKYHELAKKKKVKKSLRLEILLRTRPVRSLSGIVNISLLTKPYPCPGRCLYCPQEKGIPKSYLSGEPAVERAKKLKYNPFLQVKRRIEMLEAEGHPTDKIELRVVGGTWSYYPKSYQNWFIKRCFEACNQIKGKSLADAQKQNEKAKYRIIGLSVETRPDFINPEEIRRLRELGTTMVELGVQSIYDDVLGINLRGHKVKETVLATRLLKDAGFKVLYQMMPNLPGSSPKRDEKMFEELFSNSDFQPDLLKIYPCALIKSSPLFKQWQQGKYRPYAKNQLINLLKKIKKKIPCYVRIQRISRDIPSFLVVAGPAKISNLRQIIAQGQRKEGWSCHCIRCREVKEKYDPKEKLFLYRKNYKASLGLEIFLSFEDKKRSKLYSLLRLRLTSENRAVIRELHTYGQLLPVGERMSSTASPQHRGLGRKLIKTAEKIAKKEFGLKEIVVISGIGARNYFKQLGYRFRDTYMVKPLNLS